MSTLSYVKLITWTDPVDCECLRVDNAKSRWPSLLQVAQQGQTGPWLLRPLFRAAFWAFTVLPAHLEAMIPSPPSVPLSALELGTQPLPDGHHCAWASDAGSNSSSRASAVSTLVNMTGYTASAGGWADWSMAS